MITDPKKAFESWAPPHSIWAPWAKPVPFVTGGAPMDLSMTPSTEEAFPLTVIPPVDKRTAIVLDLEGPVSVWYGLMLGKMGYQPVPLFNAVYQSWALVNVDVTRRRLLGWADDLAPLSVPANAPPAFMIDAGRRGNGADALPGKFDNRSVVFPQDFPSAEFMLASGIKSVLLIRERNLIYETDIGEVLSGWKRGGMDITGTSIDQVGSPAAIDPKRPFGGGFLWYRLLVLLGLRRHSAGGFGGIIPEPSSGGGGG